MNILFICTANRDRSRTAEHIFQEIYPEINFNSAGIDQELCLMYNGEYVQYQMCDNADRIICMEDHHAQYILKKFGDLLLNKVEILGVEDNEEYMSRILIKELKEKFEIF